MNLGKAIKTIKEYWPIYTIGAALVGATVTVTTWSFNLSKNISELELEISSLNSEISKLREKDILSLNSEISKLDFNISLSQTSYDIDKSKYEEALNTISGLLQDKSIGKKDLARLYLLQGNAYYGMNKCNDKARTAYQLAYEESKDNPGMTASALLAKSQVLISCDDPDDWRAAQEELNLIKDRFTTEVRLNLALIHLLCEEFDDASKKYDTIIKEIGKTIWDRSTCIAALIGRGLADALPPNGDINAAIKRFSETVRKYPESKILFLGSAMKERQQQHQHQRCLEFLKRLRGREEYIDFLKKLNGS